MHTANYRDFSGFFDCFWSLRLLNYTRALGKLYRGATRPIATRKTMVNVSLAEFVVAPLCSCAIASSTRS